MKVIVGLGNPGSKYEDTRHNLGFLVVQRFAEMNNVKFVPSQHCKGLEATTRISGDEVKLLLPITFMNLSGRAVKSFLRHYERDVSDLLVVCDDFHLLFGQLRLRRKGSGGGHNGLSSVIEMLGSDNFCRLRVGIGEPKGKQDIEDFVLSVFDSQEKKELDFFAQKAADCCHAWVTEEIEHVMSSFNKRNEDG